MSPARRNARRSIAADPTRRMPRRRPGYGPRTTPREEMVMGDDRVQDLKGRAKEAAGDLTGDEDLESKGQTDQAKAGVKGKVGDVKEKAGDVVEGVKDKVDELK